MHLRILIFFLFGFPLLAFSHTPAAGASVDRPADSTITVLFFGDSITAGYGLDVDQAFPAILEKMARDEGFALEAVNAGVSGETSAGGLRRVGWILQRPFDLFVLELGGNDALRGIDPDHTRDNLAQIIDKVLEERPESKILLAGMEAPPNMGNDYRQAFRQLYVDLAESRPVSFMPFILEDVAGEPELNLPDGIHPTPEGHRIIAGNLWEVLKPVLEELMP
ncbi:arylesterase [Balneolales bacterium ANBcel1]|nr:arylesterase [Balneolales bacterium ANBcel1]